VNLLYQPHNWELWHPITTKYSISFIKMIEESLHFLFKSQFIFSKNGHCIKTEQINTPLKRTKRSSIDSRHPSVIYIQTRHFNHSSYNQHGRVTAEGWMALVMAYTKIMLFLKRYYKYIFYNKFVVHNIKIWDSQNVCNCWLTENNSYSIYRHVYDLSPYLTPVEH
jgi:hypothetical protein